MVNVVCPINISFMLLLEFVKFAGNNDIHYLWFFDFGLSLESPALEHRKRQIMGRKCCQDDSHCFWDSNVFFPAGNQVSHHYVNVSVLKVFTKDQFFLPLLS